MGVGVASDGGYWWFSMMKKRARPKMMTCGDNSRRLCNHDKSRVAEAKASSAKRRPETENGTSKRRRSSLSSRFDALTWLNLCFISLRESFPQLFF